MTFLTPFLAMCYDILALILTIVGLRKMPSSNVIWRVLRKQGVAYVVVTCLANIIPTVRVTYRTLGSSWTPFFEKVLSVLNLNCKGGFCRCDVHFNLIVNQLSWTSCLQCLVSCFRSLLIATCSLSHQQVLSGLDLHRVSHWPFVEFTSQHGRIESNSCFSPGLAVGSHKVQVTGMICWSYSHPFQRLLGRDG